MAKLSYKTRGNTTPQGKQKVFFCCHPDDFQGYFETISDEILIRENCAVWYDTEPTAEYDSEAFLADLKEMQLFVMPVTTRLLATKNRAIDIEFKFAVENHIPVLPLMQESGLVKLFNEKCGDLQYLDKNNKDDTAISYDEKLTKYLSAVLIGDELAQKIREAFDAYVFLSYRKKDRKYAQELMRLIHKNDFCRDIAIWYDEFLTPGENFNDSIKAALEKSKLFVLTVTPNLINEKNYVMTTEYPMAKKSNKPILPAEMTPTDKAELEEKYPEIPSVTDAHDDSELSKALMEAVKNLAIRENDTPEHNFFIGLAYLGGVDVEVDHAKALSLITSSAEDGVKEAIKKLVSMYRTGEGVARDYEMAIEWQRKLVTMFKQEYEKSPSEDSADTYFWAMNSLGGFIYELRNIEKAKSVYAKMHEFSVSALKKYPESRVLKRDLSVSYNNLGAICKAEGNLTKAKEYYEKSLKIREILAKETNTVEARRDLSVSYNNLGYIFREEGNLTKAKEYYEKSLKIREILAKETNTVEARRDLSVSYVKLGEIYQAEGNLAMAKEYYEKSLKIAESLAKETNTVEARRNLSVSYVKLGEIYQAEGNLAMAKEYYEKSLKI
ncbi:MAG: toll/interleukin-1 receptor domain-containing protein, partial [Clostridia bacterium]|nr:toll/interleukin-1 receptor domain-containing protein [Clostridia bacterium]